MLNDGPIGGFSLNGKGFPATQPLVAKKGERLLIRYMNEGLMIHPMHLHGMPMTVFAQDGYLMPQPYMCDTLNIAPGQRFETIVEATEPGVWAFHCHILNHAESEQGMYRVHGARIAPQWPYVCRRALTDAVQYDAGARTAGLTHCRTVLPARRGRGRVLPTPPAAGAVAIRVSQNAATQQGPG